MEIIASHLTKQYGNQTVLHDVSLTFNDGQFVGILGPNGAGKSTLMKILTGQILPTTGHIQWQEAKGKLTLQERSKILGFVHQNSVLDDFLTVKENLISRGALHGLSKETVLERINEMNDDIDVTDLLDKRYQTLSGGQKRRVDIAAAMIHRPKLLILDEPTTGIDPETRADLWKTIHQLRQKSQLSIILITHYLEEMGDVDELVLLLSGEIKYQGSVKSFINDHSNNIITLRYLNGEVQHCSYNTLAEKIQLINDAYQTNKLLDFKDEPTSLEKAYLHMLQQNKLSVQGESDV